METTQSRLAKLKTNLRADALAGLTFAIVNVPQSMGHALLATVSPVLGIFTLVVAVPLGALFTSSTFMNVSTTGALSVAAGAALVSIPEDQRTQGLAALVLLTGVIQLLAGIFRAGSVVRFVSDSVMTGFLNGVGVLIILGQLGDLTGFRSSLGHVVPRTLDLLLRVARVDIPTTVIGLLTLAVIVFLLHTRFRKFAFIVAIGVSTLVLVALSLPMLGLSEHFGDVRTVGDVARIPRSLPEIMVPSLGMLERMILPAFAVAVIGLIQGAGVSQGFPNPDGRYPNVSRDFLGQGVANIATSFVGGLPAGGSISGTALIRSAGAQSRVTNILAGFFVAMVVLLAAPLAERVPMPALAALLIVTGYQGLRLSAAITSWNIGRISATVMAVTFLATLFLPLHYAVLLGMALSLVLTMVSQSNGVVVTEWAMVPGGMPEERPAPAGIPSGRLTVLQIYGSLFFSAARSMEQMLPSPDHASNAVVALLLRGRSDVGGTFVSVLRRYHESLRAHGSRLMLVGVDPEVREQLARTGLLKELGEENVFLATPQLGVAMNQAVAAANAWIDQTAAAGPNAGRPV